MFTPRLHSSRWVYLFIATLFFLNPNSSFSQIVFTVNSVLDNSDNNPNGVCDDGSGACSLRAAMEEANSIPGVDTIKFDISGIGPHTIQPGLALPTINESVVIDGTSEPDFIDTPIIELDGSNAGVNAHGFNINTDSCTVKGLVINRFSLDGVVITGFNAKGNLILGNFIGTDISGSLALGNGLHGVSIVNAPGNTVGGSTDDARNVISGNIKHGVEIIFINSSENLVKGNYIGTDVSGSFALPNEEHGVAIVNGAQSNTVGGTIAAERNLISTNGQSGILIQDPGSINNVILGNYIGTDVTGTIDLGNTERGIVIGATSNNVVGGTDSSMRNIISGNEKAGVYISLLGQEGAMASANLIQGNYIGTDVSGTHAIGNGNGVLIFGQFVGVTANIIGGTEDGAGNLISGNAHGIQVRGVGANSTVIKGNYIGTDTSGTVVLANAQLGILLTKNSSGSEISQNIISSIGGSAIKIWNGSGRNVIGGDIKEDGNSFTNNVSGVHVLDVDSKDNQILFNTFSNITNLNIDLDQDGITVNDSFDIDDGPNNLQNFPVIESASYSDCDSLVIVYSVDSDPTNSLYPIRVQFYGSGGEKFVMEDNYTVQDFEAGSRLLKAGHIQSEVEGDSLVSTATDLDGNTSEFSSSFSVNYDECVVGIKPLTNPLEIDLRIYPNPSDDNIFISFNNQNGDLFQILIFDKQGRLVFEKKNNSKELIKIPGNHLKKGVYILQMTINEKSYTVRFIRN